MTTPFAAELAEELIDAAQRRDWSSVKAALTVLCEQIVQALTERRDADVGAMYELVERAYSTLATRPASESTVEAQLTAGELRALTRVLAVAAQYRKPAAPIEIARDNGNRQILEQLYLHTDGLSGRELADRLGMRPETIARKLPALRQVGLVKTQQVGKANVNRITESGRQSLGDLQDRSAVSSKEVVVAKTVVTPAPLHGRKSKPQRVSVLASQGAVTFKPIAKVFLRQAGERLAGMNAELATLIKENKGHPIQGLTLRLLPKKASVVGSIDYVATPGGAAVVMVVDDSLTVRRLTQRLLERAGYQVLLAKDGVDAQGQLQQSSRPDVMLVDIEMPHMDGVELARSVRAARATRDIPIIMTLSGESATQRERAREIGVEGCLHKPFDEDELLGLIKRLEHTTVSA